MTALYSLNCSEHWEMLPSLLGNLSVLHSQTFQRGWPGDQGYLKTSLAEGELKTLELLERRVSETGDRAVT